MLVPDRSSIEDWFDPGFGAVVCNNAPRKHREFGLIVERLPNVSHKARERLLGDLIALKDPRIQGVRHPNPSFEPKRQDTALLYKLWMIQMVDPDRLFNAPTENRVVSKPRAWCPVATKVE